MSSASRAPWIDVTDCNNGVMRDSSKGPHRPKVSEDHKLSTAPTSDSLPRKNDYVCGNLDHEQVVKQLRGQDYPSPPTSNVDSVSPRSTLADPRKSTSYIISPSPSSPESSTDEIFDAPGVRRVYPSVFGTSSGERRANGLPPSIRSPAFDLPAHFYNGTNGTESPLRSPLTTPSSSRRSSLGDETDVDAAALATKRAFERQRLQTVQEEARLEEEISNAGPKSSRSTSHLSSSTSSSLDRPKSNRSRSSTLSASSISSYYSTSQSSSTSDYFSAIGDVKDSEPSPHVLVLEAMAEALEADIPASPPTANFASPYGQFSSYSSSEESLFRPRSPFTPKDDSHANTGEKYQHARRRASEDFRPLVVNPKGPFDPAELDARLRRAKTFADLNRQQPTRDDIPDVNFLPKITSGLRSSSPVGFNNALYSPPTAILDYSKSSNDLRASSLSVAPCRSQIEGGHRRGASVPALALQSSWSR